MKLKSIIKEYMENEQDVHFFMWVEANEEILREDYITNESDESYLEMCFDAFMEETVDDEFDLD